MGLSGVPLARRNAPEIASFYGLPVGIKAVLTDEATSRPGPVSNEIDAALGLGNCRLRELKAKSAQKINNPVSAINGLSVRQAEQNEVVHITTVAPNSEFALNKMVDRVEIDERVELTQQVSDWDAQWLAMISKHHHQIHETAVFDPPLNQTPQNNAVDAIEKLSDVEFQGIAVSINGLERSLGVVRSSMCAFPCPTSKRLIDESRVENGVNQPIDCMLHYQVAERRSEYLPRLWFRDHETDVRRRPIQSFAQLARQVVDIPCQPALELIARHRPTLAARRSRKRIQQRIPGERLAIEISNALHDA